MRPNPQSFLPGFNSETALAAHGGDHTKGKRKTYRPIDPKQALHVVLRSSLARGERSMLHPKHCNSIHGFTRKVAKRWGVRICSYSNVGNHLHLLIKVPSRTAWQRFLKELAGGIPILVTGAKKGAALLRRSTRDLPESAQRGFWDGLAFTRIVSLGRDFQGVLRYLLKNLFESIGVPMKKLQAQGYRIVSIGPDGAVSDAPP